MLVDLLVNAVLERGGAAFKGTELAKQEEQQEVVRTLVSYGFAQVSFGGFVILYRSASVLAVILRGIAPTLSFDEALERSTRVTEHSILAKVFHVASHQVSAPGRTIRLNVR